MRHTDYVFGSKGQSSRIQQAEDNRRRQRVEFHLVLLELLESDTEQRHGRTNLCVLQFQDAICY